MMEETRDAFNMYENSPDSLYDQSLNYIIKNLHTITTRDPDSSRRWLKLKDGISLPTELCETFLHMYQKTECVNDNIANLFNDTSATKLKSVKLRNSRISDDGMRTFMQHKPETVVLAHCEYLSHHTLNHINENSDNLKSLKLGPVTFILPQDENLCRSRGFTINATNLRSLTIRRRGLAIFPTLLLRPLPNLVHLDLTECTAAGPMWVLTELKSLQSLVLHSVQWSKEAVKLIATLKGLKHLDISHANDRHGRFLNPNGVLAYIMKNLPNLQSLDISGTNLAGTGASVQAIDVPDGVVGIDRYGKLQCDIPGLISRVDNPLEFLGLYGTMHGACKRHDIPAKQVTGDANEKQILLASRAYMDRPAMLTRVLNDLYYLFRYENNGYVGHTLATVLEAMEKHPTEKHIQISGSATLFYIVKGKEKSRISIKLNRKIISALLDAMESHIADDTMMRNGCLTLCQFKIPQDVLFEYDRVVLILLTGVSDVNQEGFVQRIAIYLLNSLACQVDGTQKQFLGNHGAISKMLKLIADRLERQICDDVLEVAWSTMWNVTDETPDNCRRFLENRGMEFFIGCLKFQAFPNKDELLRNMMGLLGNVAEVAELRPQLMDKTFLAVFNTLLESDSDGIEVSYNAAGVLAHMASDGPEHWTVDEPDRDTVLERMAIAVSRWDLNAERNINYRSFEPILGLLGAHHTPQCQHWATWALANLTTVYPEKYCGLVDSEGGLRLLACLQDHPAPYDRIKYLAQVVIDNCSAFAVAVANLHPSPMQE